MNTQGAGQLGLAPEFKERETMRVYMLTKNGRSFFTDQVTGVTSAIERMKIMERIDVVTVEMGQDKYNEIPASNESLEFFGSVTGGNLS